MASVKTNIGRQKMAQALAGTLGRELPSIAEMVVGDGGIDTNTSLPKPLSGGETALFNEVLRKPVNTTFPVQTTSRFTITVDADGDSLVGTNINEAGLYDTDGDLVAVKTFTNKGLDEGTVIDIDYDAEF